MSFTGLLREIVEGCGGGIGAVLMGNDGIPIEQVVAAPVPEGPLGEDLATAGVEFGRILDDIRKASDALSGARFARRWWFWPGSPSCSVLWTRTSSWSWSSEAMATSGRRAI